MKDVARCFFAYPSRPADLRETLGLAIRDIRTQGAGVVVPLDWRQLRVGGKIIIYEVLRAIDSCELFACDLTYINVNVLFELGYAVAKNKRIWITLMPSIKGAKAQYKRLNLLANVGYTEYENGHVLASKFLGDQPFSDLESSIYDRAIRLTLQSPARRPHLLYLKSPVETDASVALSRQLQASPVGVVTDDPREIASQPLAWYVENVHHAVGLVAHLVDDRRRIPGFHNAKYSFVSGMALGLGKEVLMLAHEPYEAPIDYVHLLRGHRTASECKVAIQGWLPHVEELYKKQNETYMSGKERVRAANALMRVDLGQAYAENERLQLSEYFVETAEYRDALHASGSVIFVGRKGTGKTANLFRMCSELEQERASHVCVIRPADYDLEGVRRLFGAAQSKAEPGYLAESLWKFLLYTELAASVYEAITRSMPYMPRDAEEDQLISYADENRGVILRDFTTRMEQAIENLCQMDGFHSVSHEKVRVSEILHSKILGRLRQLLGDVLARKRKVLVLVDNLDKAWMPGPHLDNLCQFLFGLLGASSAVSREFRKTGTQWRRVEFSVIIFLRSDIFAFVMAQAREKDKVPVKVMNWTDLRLLERVIEERFAASLGEPISSAQLWQRFFPPSVNGIPTREYLLTHIIPRPRDIIYFCKAALSAAVNHRHATIEEADIDQAEKEYSQNVLDSLIAETGAQVEHFEELLYEFAGERPILNRRDLERLFRKADIPNSKHDYALSLLCDLTFLGLETGPDSFQFIYDERTKGVLESLARKEAERRGEQRFKVNVPFHSYLEIQGE